MVNSTNFDKERPASSEGAIAFRLRSVDHLPHMAQEEFCPIIKQYFDYLEKALVGHGERADIGLLQEMLLEISMLLRSGKGQIRRDGYLRMLDRLTDIYAKGQRVENDLAFARTASYFAEILESVSQQFQDYDYSRAVSLMLHYMNRLFNAREESWLEVYEHLLNMPETLHIMQQLRVEHIDEINTWIEEGVYNLFTLRDEQLDMIEIQADALRDLDHQIMTRQSQLANPLRHKRVVDIKHATLLHEIERLGSQRQKLMLDREGKFEIIELLETNIQEFSDRLAQMRRSTLIKLAWNNPETY